MGGRAVGKTPGRARRIGRAGRIIVVGAVVLLLAGCGEMWIVTYDGNGHAGDEVDAIVLTPDGTDEYVIDSSGVKLQAVALPTNMGGNLRTAFWPAAAPSVLDSQSCATWVSQPSAGNTQQGAALRVTTDSTGATRAITVTKNIFYGFITFFNVHVVDTSKSPVLTRVGQVDFGEALGGKPFPWHVCAQVVGTTVAMKVWTGTEAEPAWDDAVHARSVTVPEAFVYPGKAGWYIGHLPADGSADFTDLKTWKYAVPDSTIERLAPSAPSPAASIGSGGGTPDRVKISAEP
jgi:hypothetical protein